MLSRGDGENEQVEQLIYDDYRRCGCGNSTYDRIPEMQRENVQALLGRFEQAIQDSYHRITRISVSEYYGSLVDRGRDGSDLRISVELQQSSSPHLEQGSCAIADFSEIPSEQNLDRSCCESGDVEIAGLTGWV